LKLTPRWLVRDVDEAERYLKAGAEEVLLARAPLDAEEVAGLVRAMGAGGRIGWIQSGEEPSLVASALRGREEAQAWGASEQQALAAGLTACLVRGRPPRWSFRRGPAPDLRRLSPHPGVGEHLVATGDWIGDAGRLLAPFLATAPDGYWVADPLGVLQSLALERDDLLGRTRVHGERDGSWVVVRRGEGVPDCWWEF